MFHANESGSKGHILISDKTDFKVTHGRRDKGPFILIKVVNLQEDITVLGIHPLNTGMANYIKHILLDKRSHINSYDSRWPQFPTFSPIDRSYRRKIHR